MSSSYGECVLRFEEQELEVPRWTSYTFHSDFLTPADGFTFSVGDPDIPKGLSGNIREGQKVSLVVNGATVSTGYIDEVHAESTRGGGTVLTFSGRDVLGDAIDSIIDPTVVFQPTQTLETIVSTVMAPFGFTGGITADNDANRSLISGNKYGHTVIAPSSGKHSGRAKSKAGQATKAATAYQSKPHEREGAYEFCERLAKRLGLHIWATGDGKTLVVGKPDFDQESKYQITRRHGAVSGAGNNVISGQVNRSRAQQPSIIVAAATGGGGSFSRSTNKVIAVNELVARNLDGSLVPDVAATIAKFPKAYVMGPVDFDGKTSPLALNPYPRCRPLYLYDAEARDIEQLKNFVKRELAQRQRRSLTCSYEVEGHIHNDGPHGDKVWSVDSIVSVSDDVGDVHEDMWIESVTFTKSRGTGTVTHLGLIRPWTLTL